MRLIAHRGLVDGPNAALENTTESIQHCLNTGLDVEVDIWYHNAGWRLGHDAPTISVTDEFVAQPNLWIHAKNSEACQALSKMHRQHPHLNFFWHENDARVLSSQGFWWTNPGKPLVLNAVAVMPEWYTPLEQLRLCSEWDIYGICSDYINLIQK